MPNKPDPQNQLIGIRMPRVLYTKVQKLAAKREESIKDTLLSLIALATSDIQLTKEDYAEIDLQVALAEEKYRKQ